MSKERIISPRNYRKKTGFSLSKMAYWVLLVAFIGVLAYIFLFSPYLSVTKINVEGTDKLNPDLIKESISAYLSGGYFNLISKNNVILINENKVGKMLSDKFKAIDSVRVEKKFPSSLQIEIIEKIPQLLFCSRGNCHIIGSKGIAYPLSDFEATGMKEEDLLALNDNGNSQVSFQEILLEPDYINFVLGIKNKLKSELNIDIERELELPQLASGDVIVRTKDGWKIYFNKEVEIEKEIEMLRVVLANKIRKEERKNLEYIDLRKNNKVYYKLKDAS